VRTVPSVPAAASQEEIPPLLAATAPSQETALSLQTVATPAYTEVPTQVQAEQPSKQEAILPKAAAAFIPSVVVRDCRPVYGPWPDYGSEDASRESDISQELYSEVTICKFHIQLR
jgi:hypothetical protein